MFASSPGNNATPRYVFYVLAAVCLILIGYAALRSVQLLDTARAQTLAEAERAIVSASAEHIRQDRVPNALILAAESLLGDPELGLNYITVRNANNVTLVSRGRFSSRFGFLGTGTARALRGWDYRFESAEAVRAITASDETRVVGYAQFGVSWASVFAQAGIGLIIWLTLLLAGLVGFFGALVASPTQRDESSRNEPQTAPARIRKPVAQPESAAERARAPLSRLARRHRKKGGDNEFEPITPVRSAPAAGKPEPIQPEKPAAPDRPVPPPIRQPWPDPAATAEKRPSAPAPAPTPERKTPATEPAQPKAEPLKQTTPKPDAATQASSAAAAPAVDEPAAPRPAPDKKARAPVGPSEPAQQPAKAAAERAGLEIAPARTELHAPRLDAEPHLGDATLDLRFYPIWRDVNREILAGACAALAWRTPETQLVDADTLTRLAEQKGALRAFTQWIARRFSLLHSNWRTLEINTVPIVLPIPSAMLAFADAEAVWRDALRRTDRDPNDLILRLISTRSRRAAHSALPVRRALTLAGHDKAVPADCDVACIDSTQVGPDIEAWFARIEQLKCPVLLGPIAEPEPFARLINHSRVLWFSDDAQALYSPRAFARLLTRCSTQPI